MRPQGIRPLGALAAPFTAGSQLPFHKAFGSVGGAGGIIGGGIGGGGGAGGIGGRDSEGTDMEQPKIVDLLNKTTPTKFQRVKN